jgi:competence protein ComEA
VDSPDDSRLHADGSPGRSSDGVAVHRPSPRGARIEQLREWGHWFGFGRLISAAVAVVVVCAGAYWLVRTPPPPTEALLPRASTTSSTPPISTGTALASAPPTASPTTAVTTPATAVVHVAGAVVSAGVYRVDVGARVDDAIRLAGGPTPDADIDVVNLAAIVVDGSRIYVPHVGESVRPEVVPSGSTGAGSAAAGSGSESEGPRIVNVNTATVEELDELPGVGPATAAAIVAEREGNGPFTGVDDLDRVPGIGPAKLDALRDLVAT